MQRPGDRAEVDAGRWRRVWELFHQVADQAGEVRTRALERACAGDAELLAEVEALLVADAAENALLDSPLVVSSDQVADPALGEWIGRYRLERVLGQGGMGTVYVARQEEPVERTVALKVLQQRLVGDQALARFESERQALALMDHPNIARAYDAGSVGRRPYFAMELIDGKPLTADCDRRRLALDRRLELFVSVCQAVQHAHQKGVLHRDLKPSNVLVTEVDGVPVPKVIDFGIAKALGRPLSRHARETELGQLLGTPEYMSPEQAGATAWDVDSRSDIYSLGVLLYELVTGELPFDSDALRSSSLVEMARLLADVSPPAPSARVAELDRGRRARVAEARSTTPQLLVRRLRGDLDDIVAKALAKSPDDRYASAAGLAADVQRHRRQQPVLAGAPGAFYRAGKFVRRHRAAVATGTLLVLLLVGVAIQQAVQAARVARALEVANEERVKSESVSAFLLDLFRASSPFDRRRAADATARELLDRGAERVGTELADQPAAQAELLGGIGRVYYNLGLYERAAPLLEEALKVRRRELGDRNLDTAESAYHLGILRWRLADYASAEQLLDEALATRRDLLGEEDPRVVESMQRLGLLLHTRGDQAAADPLLRGALEVERRRAAGGEPAGLEAAVEQVAQLALRQGRLSEAEALYLEALELHRRSGNVDNAATVTTLGGLGAVYVERGELDEAEAPLRRALELGRERLGDAHPLTVSARSNLALVELDRGRYETASELFRLALAQSRERYGDRHPIVASTLNNLALVSLEQGELDEAERLLDEALDNSRSRLGDDHPDIAFPLNNLGRVHHARGELEPAERLYREALAIRDRHLPKEHPARAASLVWLGRVAFDRGALEECEPPLREALEIRRAALGQADWRVAQAEGFLGECLARRGLVAEARSLLDDSLGRFVAALGGDHPRSVAAARRVETWRSELADRAEPE